MNITTEKQAADQAGNENLTSSDPTSLNRRPPTPNRGPGRPRLLCTEERERLILDAMERVLVSHGLHGASMAAIAREAGMSKRTVYQVFDNRAALFTACIRRIRLSFVRQLRQDETELPLRERLWRMLTPDMRLVLSDKPVAILRAVIAESQRSPDLAEAFLAEGPRAARRIVQEELNRSVASGEIPATDTNLAARILCDMVYENPVERLVTSDAGPQVPTDGEARLNLALDLFVRGVAAPSKTPPMPH